MPLKDLISCCLKLGETEGIVVILPMVRNFYDSGFIYENYMQHMPFIPLNYFSILLGV